jgi:hypothetical protein
VIAATSQTVLGHHLAGFGDDVDLNDGGVVAYVAGFSAGGAGLFLHRPDGTTQLLARSWTAGDPAGSTGIQFIDASPQPNISLNRHGNVAFHAALKDAASPGGRKAIILARPKAVSSCACCDPLAWPRLLPWQRYYPDGTYKGSYYALLDKHGLSELVDRIKAAGGDIKDVSIADLSTGTRATYNETTDAIKIASRFALDDGALRGDRSLISTLAHETLHAYVDQVVKRGLDLPFQSVLQRTENWLATQVLRESGSINRFAPGSHPADVAAHMPDFAEEYATQITNDLVQR